MNLPGETDRLLLLGAMWALFLLALYLMLPRLLPRREISVRRALLIVGVVALTARLIPNWILPMGAGYDIESYQLVGDLVRRGEEVYSSPTTANRYPYLPLQMYWMSFALWGAGAFHLSFVKIVRLAPIAADVGIALLLVFSLWRSASPKAALYAGLAYAFNPIPVFVSAYHGQFDALPAFAILLALYWLDKSPLTAGGWLGLGILDKSWPMLAFPSLVIGAQAPRKRLFFVGAAIAVPMLGVAVYMSLFGADLAAVLSRALGYNWGVGVWGYTYFFRLLSVLRPDAVGLFHWLVRNGRYVTLAALGLVWMVRARKDAPADSLLTILVAFFAVTHAFSIQYLVWVVPFAILRQQYRWVTRYTLGAFSYMFLTYSTLILAMHITKLLPWPQADQYIIMPSGLPAWLVMVGWMKSRFFGEQVQA